MAPDLRLVLRSRVRSAADGAVEVRREQIVPMARDVEGGDRAVIRRTAILALFGVQAHSLFANREHIPTDESQLNRFARNYNEYANALRAGRIDLRAWDATKRAWKEMTE